MTAPITSSTLGVNVFTAPGKVMVGERPKPFGEPRADGCGSKLKVIGIVAGHVHLLRRKSYRRPTATVGFNQPDISLHRFPFDGGTRDGLETVGPVCASDNLTNRELDAATV